MGSLKDLWNNIKGHQFVDIKQLLYPGVVKTFQELDDNNHEDKRALIYLIRDFDLEKKNPFTTNDIYSWKDFKTKGNAYRYLNKQGLVTEIDKREDISFNYTQEELRTILKETGLPVSGTKMQQIERLLSNKYKFPKNNEKRFRLTALGKELIAKQRKDWNEAIECAIMALRNLDYKKAIEAYRKYDDSWGFSHTSGKTYTIFAHFDVPEGRFRFFEKYAMLELGNTVEYKKVLKATLLAGLMRGCQDSLELSCDFERITSEPLNCPNLFMIFKDYPKEVLDNMREQVEFDKSNALRYYIGHIEYLNRKENPWF